MKTPLPILISAFLAPPLAQAELSTLDEIRSCVHANIPDVGHVQAVQLVATDRIGNERVTRAQIYGRRDEDGFRRVLARFSEPPELVGSAFLYVERAQTNDLVLHSPDLLDVKRVTGEEVFGNIVGTDFTYEDFERMRALNRPGATRRVDDQSLDGRSMYVVETRPADRSQSAYEAIVEYVDHDTCLVAKMELYESGGKLRKVMTANPETFMELHAVWLAGEVLMRDLIDETQTLLLIEGFDLDPSLDAAFFRIDRLPRAAPERPEIELEIEKPQVAAPKPKLELGTLDE